MGPVAFSTGPFSNPRLFILVSLWALLTWTPCSPQSGALATTHLRLNTWVVISSNKEWFSFFFFFFAMFSIEVKLFTFHKKNLKNILKIFCIRPVFFFFPNLFIPKFSIIRDNRICPRLTALVVKPCLNLWYIKLSANYQHLKVIAELIFSPHSSLSTQTIPRCVWTYIDTGPVHPTQMFSLILVD